MERLRAALSLDVGRGSGAGRAGERGFTIAELTVTLIVTAEIILATLLLFDASGKIGKAEMQIAGMQQSLRVGQHEIVRMLRMAGRGGLPVTNSPATVMSANLFAGTALAVRNNVAANSGVIPTTAPTDPPTPITNPRVLAGTDVLIVRGVFSTPIYQVNYASAGAFQYNPKTGTGTVIISAVSPTGVSQPFDTVNAPGSFEDAKTKNRAETLILVSPVDDTIYGVAQFDFNGSSINPATPTTPPSVTVAFSTAGASTALLSAGGAFPALNNVAYVGILEEYRYYVRELHAKPDLVSELNPLLSRARVYAGTDMAWDGDNTNLYQDIGAGVLDLQVALGFDTNPANLPTSGWLSTNVTYQFDTAADNGANPPIPLPPLLYVRLNLLARTSRHDIQYRAPLVASIEDHAYSSTPASPLDPNGSIGLTMRRRLTQTVVGMRDRL